MVLNSTRLRQRCLVTLGCAMALATTLSSASAWAQPALAVQVAAPEGQLSMSASATLEAPQDWMSLALSVTREGSDAAAVQAQLKQALEAALNVVRPQARPGQVELRSGAFSVFPRYGQKGNVTGWQGSTELLIEGRDMAAIAQLSGRVASMSIARVNYSLSREAREKLESEAAAQAIARFRAQAAERAKQFGYASFSLREVSVNTDSASATPETRMRLMAVAADAAPLPVEAGKGSVTATVSGSLQMRP